jgi:hypothetical protein
MAAKLMLRLLAWQFLLASHIALNDTVGIAQTLVH